MFAKEEKSSENFFFQFLKFYFKAKQIIKSEFKKKTNVEFVYINIYIYIFKVIYVIILADKVLSFLEEKKVCFFEENFYISKSQIELFSLKELTKKDVIKLIYFIY